MIRKILFFLLIFPVFCFSQSISLTIDKDVLHVGEQTYLHVKINGLSVRKIPEIKNIDNFNLQYVGLSSNFTIINGKVNITKVFNFILTPNASGTFEIGPAVVDYNGKIYKSNRIVVKVFRAKIKNSLGKYIFFKVNTDKKNVVLNEEILLSVKVYRKVEISNLELEEPQFKGFIVIKLGPSINFTEVINGEEYNVSEIKYALYPTITGTLIIPSFTITGTIISNFNIFKNPFSFQIPRIKTFKLSSKPVKIKVLPLPKKVYGVGDYTVKALLDNSSAIAGNTINYVITIKGKGNLKLSQNISLPSIKGLDIYKDKPDIKIKKTQAGIFSEKIEKFAIVGEKPGIYHIPSLTLYFYNPESKKIEKTILPKITIKILPGKNENLKIVENRKIINHSIEPIYMKIPFENQDVNLSINRIILTFLPGIAIGILILGMKIVIRNRKKIKSGKNVFKILKKCIKEANSAESLSVCLKEYFSEKLNLPKNSITFEEVIDRLQIKEKNIYRLLLEIEKALYSQKKEIDLDKIKVEIMEVVKEIEKINS